MSRITHVARTEILFVYGTLQSNLCNHSLLDKAIFLGQALAGERMALYVGRLPYLVREARYDGPEVLGELYLVNEEVLATLDRLEGHPNFYKREKIVVFYEGEAEKVWAYLYPSPCGTKSLSGSYKADLAEASGDRGMSRSRP